MSGMLKRNRISILLVASVLMGAGVACADYAEPTLFHCEAVTVKLVALDKCAIANAANAQDAHVKLPSYSAHAAAYFFKALTEMDARGVAFSANAKGFSFEDALLRRHLGEWLYFTQPSFINDGERPEDYAGVDVKAFARMQAYRQQDGSFLVFYWDYNGAANEVFQVVLLQPDRVTPLAAETFEGKGKSLAMHAVGYFNDFLFVPETGMLTSVNHDSYNSGTNEQYRLDGTVFRLQQVEQVTLGKHAKDTKTTLLFKRAH